MKLTSLFLILSILIICSNCSKDDSDNCTAKPFSENIVGSWNISYKILSFTNSGSGTFFADGSFTTTPPDLIVGDDQGKKTYTIQNDSLIIFKSTNGGVTVPIEGTKKTNECNKIVIYSDDFGTDFNFTK